MWFEASSLEEKEGMTMAISVDSRQFGEFGIGQEDSTVGLREDSVRSQAPFLVTFGHYATKTPHMLRKFGKCTPRRHGKSLI